MRIDDDQVYDLLEEPYKKSAKLTPEKTPVHKRPKKSKKEHKNRARSRSNESHRTPSDSEHKDYEEPQDFRSSRRRRRDDSPNLTPVERDARTVYIWQISHRVVKRDLYDFFSAVGKIRTVRLIHDPKTGRSKGIGYIEFREIESAQLAIGLSGIRLLGVPLQVQPIKTEYDAKTNEQIEEEMEAEKRKRQENSPERRYRRFRNGPTKIYVGSLHFNINEEMLRGIFEPFGTIDVLNLVKNEYGKSQGYAYITFSEHDFAVKAVNSMDNFELAGRPMKVTLVSDKTDAVNFKILDENTGRGGIQMGATGRIALMAKLAEGTDVKIPRSAMAQLHISQQKNGLGTTSGVGLGSSKTLEHSQCFLLSNMFDPHQSSGSLFKEITEDVIDECAKFGGIQHLFIDKTSAQGNVYVKCPNVDIAIECVNRLHGRYFSGQQITASYVPMKNYNRLFPNSVDARRVIKTISDLNN